MVFSSGISTGTIVALILNKILKEEEITDNGEEELNKDENIETKTA